MLAKALARSHRLLGAPHPVHPGPAARATSPASPSSTRTPRDFEFQPGASSPTSSSATRSTAPRPRPSRRCWSAWRSARSPSTARPTSSQAPFMVIATQNPIEMEGTYPLPEAQRDRFMARVSMGYPVAARRARDARHATARQPARRPRAGHRRRRRSRELIAGRPRGARRPTPSSSTPSTSSPRPARTPDLRLGASPRATLHLLRAAKAARRARRPRLRAPRRRAGARRAGARPPAPAVDRGPARPPHDRRGRRRPPPPGAGAADRPLSGGTRHARACAAS